MNTVETPDNKRIKKEHTTSVLHINLAKLQTENDRLRELNNNQLEELRLLRGVVGSVRNALLIIDKGSKISVNMEAIPELSSHKMEMLDLTRNAIGATIGKEMKERTKKDKASMRMLKALALFPSGSTHSRMCLIAGVSPRSSTYRGGMAWLRAEEYVQEQNEILVITRQGMLAAGPVEKPGDLVRFWASITRGSTGIALQTLNKVYPNSYTKNQLAALIRTDVKGSTMRAIMSKLRRNKLILESGHNITLSHELKE